VRRTPALVSSVAVTAVLSAALVGCAASPDDVRGCTPALPAGETAALVTATGEVGSVPDVRIPAPLVAGDSERATLTAGSGLVAQQGMTVDYDAVLLDAATGQPLQQTSFDGSAHLTRAGGEGALAASFVCAQAGERIAVTTTIGESGLAAGGASEVDLARSLVIVVDITGVYLGQADGVNQWPTDGLPVVVTAVDGTVGITVPSGLDLPTESRSVTIKRGSGAMTALGDTIVVQRGNWGWSQDGTIAQKSSTWSSGYPLTLTLTDDGEQAVPDDLLTALVGVPVGSQVLLALPPTTGADATPGGAEANVVVVDVLGIRSSAESTK